MWVVLLKVTVWLVVLYWKARWQHKNLCFSLPTAWKFLLNLSIFIFYFYLNWKLTFSLNIACQRIDNIFPYSVSLWIFLKYVSFTQGHVGTFKFEQKFAPISTVACKWIPSVASRIKQVNEHFVCTKSLL